MWRWGASDEQRAVLRPAVSGLLVTCHWRDVGNRSRQRVSCASDSGVLVRTGVSDDTLHSIQAIAQELMQAYADRLRKALGITGDSND